MDTVQALSHVVENSQYLAYLLIFSITIFEGEIVAISAGILILLGALNFWIALLAIILGSTIKTFLGYFIGKFLNQKLNHNKFFQYIEKKVLTVMPHFEEKPFWSIFFSKFLMVNHVVIIFAGYKKINFKRYLKAEMMSTPLWALSLVSLGYFFSYTALQINKGVTEFFLIILLFIIGFFLIEKVVSLLFDVFQNIFHNHEHKQ
jgi:membrane protein DedA with SNARE-associated domain